MPGKLEMPKYNSRAHFSNHHVVPTNDLIEEEPSGIYLNEPLLQTLAIFQGCEVSVKTKVESVYQGIFVSVSPKCELLLTCVHEVVNGQSDVLPIKSDVFEEMVFPLEEIVNLAAVTDTDSLSRVASSFAIDSDIGKQQRFNGDPENRKFEVWEPEHEEEHTELEPETHSTRHFSSSSGVMGIPAGWSVRDMFEKNKEIGVDSTFDENLTQYTNVHPNEDDPEYEAKKREAERLAREIESNPVSKRAQELENEDEERDLDRANFGSYNRTAVSPSSRGFQPVSYGRQRNPDRRGGNPRGGGMNRPGDRNMMPQGSLTFTNTNRDRDRRDRGGGGPQNWQNRQMNFEHKPGRYSGHERSPPVGSAEDSNWREVKSRNNRRMENQMSVPPPPSNFQQPPPPQPQQPPPVPVHAETLPRARGGNHRGKTTEDLKKFHEKFKLAGSGPVGDEQQRMHQSSQQQQQQAQAQAYNVQHPQQVLDHEPQQQKEPPPKMGRSPVAVPAVSANQRADTVQMVTAPLPPVATELQAPESAPLPTENIPPERPPPVSMPPPPQQQAPPPQPKQPIRASESPAAPPGVPGMIQSTQSYAQEKTPELAKGQDKMDMDGSSGSKQFRFNPDAPMFTPRNPNLQYPSPAVTPSNSTGQLAGNPPPLVSQIPLYPPQAPSPVTTPIQQQAPIAVYHPGMPGATQVVSMAAAVPQPGGFYQQGVQQFATQPPVFTGPPPTFQTPTVTGPRNRAPRMSHQGSTALGQPIMTPGTTTPVTPFVQTGAQQQQAVYPMGIATGGYQTAQPIMYQQRMMTPQPYTVIQQDGTQQIAYISGVPQVPPGQSQPQQQMMGGAAGPMSHPPPPGSNNSGASHSNNPSQPPTPGPQANPSPGPPYVATQYSQPGSQVGYYMGPGNQMIPAAAVCPMVTLQTPNGPQMITLAQYQQIAGVNAVQQVAAVPQDGTAYISSYQVPPHLLRQNSGPASFLTAQPSVPPPQGPPPHHPHQQNN